MTGRDSPPHSLVSGEVAAALCRLAATSPPGCFIEVGVYRGGTAWHLAKVAKDQDRECYLCDTFTGIPYRDEGDRHAVGDFSDADAHQVARDIPSAIVVQGVFPDSVRQLDIGPIAFAHLDCDQYQSYRDALDYLALRMPAGAFIWVDDYDCLTGATRAVDECLAEGRVRLHRAEKAYLEKLPGD